MALRIERIDFNPWGCFEDHSLSLSARSGDVDLIHGRNASGKSTTSRGERSLLYGIDARTVDNHTYDYADLRIGARLQLDSESVELERRKKRVGSLVSPGGDVLPNDRLLSALGGLSREVYEALFVVDKETLDQGGAELLAGQGEIGASLFAAAAGIASLHQTLSALEREAEHRFNPRGRTDELHKSLTKLRDAEKRLRDTTLRPARHREMEQALDQDEQASENATLTLRELDRTTRALERMRAIAPLLSAHAELVDELEKIGPVPDLPNDAKTKRVEAEGRIQAGKSQMVRVTAALEKLDAEIEGVAVDEMLIARGDEITVIKEKVSAFSKAAGDRRKREGELQEAKAALGIAASSVGVPPGEIEALKRPMSTRRTLDACLSERDELASALRGAQDRRDRAEQERADSQAALAAAPPAKEVGALEAALTAALKVGAISDQIDCQELEAKQLAREAAGRLARLAPAPASLEALRSLSAPSREHAERTAARAGVCRHAGERLDDDGRRLDDQEAELEEERRRLGVEGEAPTAEALEGARELRTTHWTEIRSAGTGGSR
jgi:uncharacterized protein YhaN